MNERSDVGIPAMSKPALHEVSSGAGDDLVVLLHGFSDNADTWNKVAPTLAEDARLLAVDLPGFGRSAASGDTPLFDGYVRVVVDLLQRHRGPGSVSIVGNSLGAVVALLVATERPELVDRVVLADMPGLTGIPRLWRLALSPPVECALTPVLRLLPAPVARTGFGFCYALAAAGLHPMDGATRSAFTAHYADRSRLLGLFTTGRDVLAELDRTPVASLVRDLTVPSLLVWGRNDTLTPARSARVLERNLHTEVGFIAHCSHCPQLDRPHEFLAVVQPFLRRMLLSTQRGEQ